MLYRLVLPRPTEFPNRLPLSADPLSLLTQILVGAESVAGWMPGMLCSLALPRPPKFPNRLSLSAEEAALLSLLRRQVRRRRLVQAESPVEHSPFHLKKI